MFLPNGETVEMFAVDWTLLVTAAVFLVTLLTLNQLLFKPLFKVLDERKSQTYDLQDKARKTLDYYNLLLDQYQSKVKEEKRLGYKDGDSVRDKALQERQERTLEARAESEGLLREATERIQNELVLAEQQLKSNAREIAEMIAARVLAKC